MLERFNQHELTIMVMMCAIVIYAGSMGITQALSHIATSLARIVEIEEERNFEEENKNV